MNSEKSVRAPQEVLTSLEVTLDLRAKIFHISNSRIESILSTLNNLISTPYVTTRKAAQIIGKILSTIFVLENIVRLETRYLFKSLQTQESWDSHFNVLYYQFTIDELTFWKQNVQALKKRPLILYKLPITKVYSDASNFGIGTCFEIKDKKYLIQKNFPSTEKCGSSTWREMVAILLPVLPSKFLNINSLFCHTDNFAVSKTVESGSSKPDLQEKAVKIFDICKVKNPNLEITWISWENNKDADFISKLIDYNDWIVKKSTFKFLSKEWSTMTVDRFASYKNSKCSVFNSKYLCPSTEAVNDFSQDLSNEANWLVSPIYLLPKCLTHFPLSTSGTTRISMLPCWPLALFWSLLFEKQSRFISIIQDRL